MEQIQSRFGLSRQECLAASSVPLATLIAGRALLPRAAYVVWVGPHRFKILALSGVAACFALIPTPPKPSEAATPTSRDPKNMQPKQAALDPSWQPLDLPPPNELESHDSHEVPCRPDDVNLEESLWRIPLKESWTDPNLPRTKKPIRPDQAEDLPGLVRAIYESLSDPGKAKRQINRDLRGCSYAIQETPFYPTEAEDLVNQVQVRLNLTPALALKAAVLMTQTCMPEISEAAGTNSPFVGEQSVDFQMARDEGSKRVVQDEHGLAFSVSRAGDQVTVVAKAGFYIQEGLTLHNRLEVTLKMNPCADEASYTIRVTPP